MNARGRIDTAERFDAVKYIAALLPLEFEDVLY